MTGVSNEKVWDEIQARRIGVTPRDKSVKAAELETLLAAGDEQGEDRVDGVFLARTLNEDEWNKPWMQGIQKVVLVQRLREVMALVGFTRFEAAGPDTEGELDINVRRAELGRNMAWVPAIRKSWRGHLCPVS